MKSLLRPYTYLGPALLAAAGLALVAAPPGAPAQTHISRMLQELKPLLSRTPGYLGVLVTDVDEDSAQKLKLKDTHGALITLIDHDAPAGPVLHVNDVVIEVNGQKIEGAEQFGRLLHGIPAGRKVSFLVLRDGATQTMTIQLVDRKAMEQEVWNKMNSSDVVPPPPSGMGILSGSGDGLTGWHMSLFTSSLNVGALVEPLTAQMADYLGIPSGVMVKQVTRKSEAAAAGLKPFDVILKVGSEPVATTADWDRAIRSNQDKPVQITILRDRKQQNITLQVDSKHRNHSRVEWTDIIPSVGCQMLAELGEDITSEFAEQAAQQMEQFRQSFNPDDFRIDPKQMDELRQQMEQFRQSFNSGTFRIDPKQMDELRRQMDEFRKNFPQNFHFDRQRLEEFQRQLEDLKFLTVAHPV